MSRSEVLWQDGRFRCEIQTREGRTWLEMSEADRAIVQLTLRSRREARDQALALRLLVPNQFEGIRWIHV
jgi:hypothetical protein